MVGLRLAARLGAPGVLGTSTFVGPVLLGMNMLALPDVAGQVAQDAGVVMVAAATGRGGLAKLAPADDAAESLVLGILPKRGATPERDAIIFGHTTGTFAARGPLHGGLLSLERADA